MSRLATIIALALLAAIGVQTRAAANVLVGQNTARRDFFANYDVRARLDGPQTLDFAGQAERCGYESASGRPKWLNRDPIAERGGINLYVTTHNNSIGLFDTLGLSSEKPCPCGGNPGEVLKKDDAGRECCDWEMVTITIRVKPIDMGFPGHVFVNTPNQTKGFYPAKKGTRVLNGPGKVKDDSDVPWNPSNSYDYKACPESADKVDEEINATEESEELYDLFNNDGGQNCAGKACQWMENAGFKAPFHPNTSRLAPGGGGGVRRYGPGRPPYSFLV